MAAKKAPSQTPSGNNGATTAAMADWVEARSATYVAIGMSRAAADKKALAEVQTQFRQDPYAVVPPGNLEAPGAAKKQLAAMQKAKLDPATNRWLVKGYGLYSEQDYANTLASLQSIVAQQPATSTQAQQSKTPKGKTTPDRPSKPAKTVVVDGKKVVVGGDKWKQIIQEEFGSLWDVYNSNPDVQKVIDQSVKEGWFNDETKLTARLSNTSWFRTTQQSARQYSILASSDPATLEAQINSEVEGLRASTAATGITFDDPTLRRLATDKIKFGWSAQQLSNAIGSEAVAVATLGGPQGISDLRSGTVGRNLRQKAAAYAQRPSDSQIDTWIQQIMRGEKSETQWEDLMRDSAKTQFRSLQPALDKGQDVETAMYAYKQAAQATLGSAIDMSEIDWTQDRWNRALNYRDERTNEYRQMDLWEWNKYLRSLPEWQNTDQARDVYRNVALGLAQGFGRMA